MLQVNILLNKLYFYVFTVSIMSKKIIGKDIIELLTKNKRPMTVAEIAKVLKTSDDVIIEQ